MNSNLAPAIGQMILSIVSDELRGDTRIALCDGSELRIRGADISLIPPDETKQWRWVVVVDDSNCTCGVGGEGYLWRAKQCSWYRHCYSLEGVGPPYDKTIFRDATEEEVANWLRDKTRAPVPPNGKPKLYRGGF